MKVNRYYGNPIIKPDDVKPSRPDFKVTCVFNAGVTRFEGEILLLMRVAEVPVNDNPRVKLVPMLDTEKNSLIIKEFPVDNHEFDFSDSRFVKYGDKQCLTSISHLRVAKSIDGVSFRIDNNPAMFPENIYERFGIEDPRITLIDGRYFINYSAISDITGVTTCLASTDDFINFKRHGVIFTPDNKDISIFPEKINGRYYAFNRPASAEYKTRDMWISESPDLICWGNHKRLMSVREGFWDDGRIGCSTVPFKVGDGWVEIYHGASKSDRYSLGAVLLDGNEPSKVLARSRYPIIEPETEYELKGFYGNVIFSCGALYEDGRVKLYYGAADTCIAYAEIDIEDIYGSF